ncbi:unnamed protein product [Closterium sp. NIES-65]|nr:unnamed protein product [Closterium sp. NIES-65]
MMFTNPSPPPLGLQGSEKSGPCTGTDKDESEEGESEEGESEEGESEEGEPAGGQRASDPTLPPAAASPRFPKRASARVVSAPAPTARKRLRADGTGDVRGVEGAGAEIGVGEGGRAASGAASGAENKGAGADEVGTAGGGQRANDARTAQAGGAEKRTVRDAKDVGKVERLRLAGIFQLESGEWVAQATIRGQQWYLGWQRSRANVLYLLCMARTVFGEPADLGLDLHTITRAAWEAEWKQARHIPPGLWAVMHGHMLTRTVHRYRMVLSSFNASAGDGESDEESRVLALCAAIGATAATVEKCGAATELYATALTASCAAVWSIWRGDSTASAVERAVAVARAVGAALPRLRLCRLAIGAVLATLGNESRVSGGAASSDPDGHVARVMEQALGGAGLARNKPAKVVVKKMVDTLGLWSACAAAADPLSSIPWSPHTPSLIPSPLHPDTFLTCTKTVPFLSARGLASREVRVPHAPHMNVTCTLRRWLGSESNTEPSTVPDAEPAGEAGSEAVGPAAALLRPHFGPVGPSTAPLRPHCGPVATCDLATTCDPASQRPQRRAAEPQASRAAQQPSRPTAEPPSTVQPSRPAAEPPSSRAARQPSRPAPTAEPPSSRAAQQPSRPAAESPDSRAAEQPDRSTYPGRAVDFEVWVDDLQLFLQCDRADGLSLFDLISGAPPTPAADADATVRSQWATRDAAARLAVRRHLPTTESAHFSQYKSAQTLYDAVVARYSSPATAALSRLMLPYLFPDLAAFPNVADLLTHLRTSDTRYRAALPAEFCAKNPPPMYITLYYIVTRLPHSLRVVRDHFLSVCPTTLTVDLLEKALLAIEKSIVAVGASRGDPHTPVFEGRSALRLPQAGDAAPARARGARALEEVEGAVEVVVEAVEGVGVVVGVVLGVAAAAEGVEAAEAVEVPEGAEAAEVVEEAEVEEEVEAAEAAVVEQVATLRRGVAPVVVSASSSSGVV